MSSIENASLLLELTEQPSVFHRCRYASETTESTVAGQVRGRSSTDSSKAFVTVAIRGINSQIHRKVKLLCCVVDSEHYLHPYSLHGHKCSQGYYQTEKDVDLYTEENWVIRFEYLGIICPQKKETEETLKKIYATELATYLKQRPSRHYNRYNERIYRLALICVYEDYLGSRGIMVVYSDEIYDELTFKTLKLDSLNPDEVSASGGDLALYSETATTGISESDLKVKFVTQLSLVESLDQQPIEFEGAIKVIEKHLIIVEVPDISNQMLDERVQATLTVCIGPAVSSELAVFFRRGIAPTYVHPARSSRKRKH